MTFAGCLKSAVKSSSLISWKPVICLPEQIPFFKNQNYSEPSFYFLFFWLNCRLESYKKTVANCVGKTGLGLHSGKLSTVKIHPELAGKGRYFDFKSNIIRASIDFVKESPLCTTLCKDGYAVRTVEHLLSALEATGVDNCRIEIHGWDSDNASTEVPIFDGSAREWVEGIRQVGLKVAKDGGGESHEKLAPFLNQPVFVSKNDSFVAAFPYPVVKIRYGIDFSKVPAIGCQWFSSTFIDSGVYDKQIASSRTFCIYEEVEKLRNAGLINGGSAENAIVCSASEGWLNPPLRFNDEPCRHKVLDLIGDVSLLAQSGTQGLPVAHIVAYKGGHSLHAEFVRQLKRSE